MLVAQLALYPPVACQSRSLSMKNLRPLYGLAAALLLLLPLTVQASDPEKAWIVTQESRPVECISPVAIRNIDGRERRLPAQGFRLEPGSYTLTGTAVLDTRYCPVLSANSWDRIQPLKAEFEAGKKYYVGLDHSSRDRADWSLVVWKIEEF
jgi:hypothetical protein